MEPVDLGVGPSGLNGLLSVSLDALDRISTAKSYGAGYHLFAAKLAIEQRRFFRWGQAVDFTRTQQHELLQKIQRYKKVSESCWHGLFTFSRTPRGLRNDTVPSGDGVVL
jgi:hypothetical protein